MVGQFGNGIALAVYFKRVGLVNERGVRRTGKQRVSVTKAESGCAVGFPTQVVPIAMRTDTVEDPLNVLCHETGMNVDPHHAREAWLSVQPIIGLAVGPCTVTFEP